VPVYLEIMLFLTQDRCMACAKCTTGSEIVLDAHDELLGDVSYVESCFGPFGYYVMSASLEIVLILTLDRTTVGA
jgi:hypothetical protein